MRKCLPLEILKSIVTKLRNHGKEVLFIRVDKDVALARYSDSIKLCHKTNIIVQNTSGYVFSLNVKIEFQNKKISNITGDLLLNSSNRK